MEDIGGKIRRERQLRGLTLENLSQKTGLSKSFLSQVERNLTRPSVTSLKKIAQYFGISVVHFFSEEEHPQNLWNFNGPGRNMADNGVTYNREVKVVRADQRKSVTLPGSMVRYDVLTPDLKRQLEVMFMSIAEGDSSGDDAMLDAPGEKFGIVLRGLLEFRVGDEVLQLGPGDSVSHPADVPHWWRGLKGDPIEVIWVQTPPTF